jgi:hypothetical protein
MADNQAEGSEYLRTIEEHVSENKPIAAWKDDLSRLVRRAEIFRRLGSELPLSEIKATVREHEKNLGVNQLVDALVSKEFVVAPKMAAVASELSQRLQHDFRFVDAVVLMGSAVHGGATLRQVMGGGDSGDLDWGLISKGPLDRAYLSKVVKRAENIIPQIASKHGIDPFRSCEVINPKQYWMPKVGSVGHARFLLKNFHDGSANFKDICLYFQPSFPPGVNLENRRLLLEGLSGFSSDNQYWTEIINILIVGWQHIHKIEYKHVPVGVFTGRRFSRTVGDSTISASKYIMDTAMEVVLQSTARGVIQNQPTIYSPAEI